MAYTKETKVIEKVKKGIRWRFHHVMELWVSEKGDFYSPVTGLMLYQTEGIKKNIKTLRSDGTRKQKRGDRIVFEAFKVYGDYDMILSYGETTGKIERLDGNEENVHVDNLVYKTAEELRAESRKKANEKKRKPPKRLTYTLLRLNDHLQDSSVEELGQGNKAQDFGEFSNMVEMIIENGFEGRAVLDKDKKSSFILMTKGMV